MAALVEIMGITHNPFLPRLLRQPELEPGMVRTQQVFDLMRDKLTAARPEVLVVVGNDHLNQTFTDTMPAFMIGKAPRASGPFEHEIQAFGLSRYQANVDVDLARYLLANGFCRDVDFAFSDEFMIDHAFTIPLAIVRPAMDLPIVPVFTNCIAPPLPPAERYYRVGLAIRDLIESYPRDLRVAVIGTGHLSVEVGGPRALQPGPYDLAFDRHMMGLIRASDVEQLLREATFERMIQAGNVTPGFLAFVLLLGVARGAQPSFAEGVESSVTATTPFMAWDLHRAEAA
jgi:protocatechuate 4,5-dioxygenase beta chain